MKGHNKLPQVVIGFHCDDKFSKETWDDPIRKTDIAMFPAPYRCCIIGSPGVGKSAISKNLVVHNNFKSVYIFHENELTKEYDDLEPTAILDELPPLSFWRDMDPKDKKLLIIDDVEWTSSNKEKLKNLALLFRYISSHCNLSIIFCHQSYFDIPPLVKKMANVIILYKIRSKIELGMIENRSGLEPGLLSYLFETVAKKYHDSICLDFTVDTPYPIRLNLWQPLVIE